MGAGGFAFDQVRISTKMNAITKVGVRRRCVPLQNYFGNLQLSLLVALLTLLA